MRKPPFASAVINRGSAGPMEWRSSAAGQTDEAIDVFLEASRRTFPLMEIGDATLIRADDIRGRSAAADYASEMIGTAPE